MFSKNIVGILSLLLLLLSSMLSVNVRLASADVAGYTQPQGLVGYWNFDQGSGTIAYDSSGNNNQGTIHGASRTGGKINGALNFNGQNNYVDCGKSETLDPTQAATLEAWINFNQLPSAANHIMEIASRSGGGTDLDLQVETDNRIKFFIGTGTPNVAISNTVVVTNTWYHIAVTYQASNNIKIYVNGVLEKTTSINIARNANPNNFTIGQSGFWPGRFFNGIIDEVKVFNRALSAQEIVAEYIHVSISPSSAVIDVGQSQQFTSSISGGTLSYSYQWYLNGEQVSGATSASWTFTPDSPGSYTVYLRVTNAASAIATSNTATASVNSLPSPSISANPTPVPTINPTEAPTAFPIAISTTSATVIDNSVTVDHSATTDVSVTVSGPSLQDGEQLNVTSTKYGDDQPQGTGAVSVDDASFYNIDVVSIDGTLIPDFSMDVSFSNPDFGPASIIQYWNGNIWDSVTTTFHAPHTVSCTIPNTGLTTGTPVLVGTPKSSASVLTLSVTSLLIIVAAVVAIVLVLGILSAYMRKKKAK